MVVENQQSLKDIIIGINFQPSSFCRRKINFNHPIETNKQMRLAFMFCF
jgi:hypothetical protein